MTKVRTIGQAGRSIAGMLALGLGIGLGVAIVAAVVGLGGQPGGVEAQPANSNVTACVNASTGQARFGWPGQQLVCSAREFPLVLGSGGSVADLEARLSAVEEQVPDCLSEDGNADAVFEGCNVRVLSGSGATDGAVNGKGNLIVGYDENNISALRTGSHNLVVGPEHSYSSYGGFVAGRQNTINSISSSVSGGLANTASGFYSSVSGGQGNRANIQASSVSGGLNNFASGAFASVGGGTLNEASGSYSSVSGGHANTASNTGSSVGGGTGNTASATNSTVGGGTNVSNGTDGTFLP